jgi:hypothetical protein
MLANSNIRIGALCAFLLALALGATSLPLAAQCVDFSKDPAGCQPSTFKTPMAQMPTVRVNKAGNIDPAASEADARAGVALLEKKLHLLRNMEEVHWVITVPSVKDPETGLWKGGELEGAGDGRGLGIAGSCIFTGHGNGARGTHAINIFKIQPNPEKQTPVQVGEIPAITVDASLAGRGGGDDTDSDPGAGGRGGAGRGAGRGGQAGGRGGAGRGGAGRGGPTGPVGLDDREIRAILYTTSRGEDRYVMMRNATNGTLGKFDVFSINPTTCLPIAKSETHDFTGQSHEFFLWHDPANPNRILIYMAMWGAGLPDPAHPGLRVPDAYVFAVTDEKTGEMLPRIQELATFTLEDVGGPKKHEQPDETGLFADGRFADYSQLTKRSGQAGNSQRQEQNLLHSLSLIPDGERVYVAGTTAGFYVLNSEAVAHHTNAELAAGMAGCNQRSTNVLVNNAIDASKLPQVANDCLHMVVNDEPGLKAFLGFASPDQKIQRYLTLMTRSRFDVYPPIPASPTGTHSAVWVPDRPAQVNGNTKNRPAYVWVTDENGGCPLNFARMVSIEVETTPVMVGAFAIPDNQLEDCLAQPTTEPNSQQPRRNIGQQNHNPTVFKNLVFNGWYAHGLRVIDISNPATPREVGYALTVPEGDARTYPVFKDGLIYWIDNNTGLHIAKYTGPRSNELPGPGSGVYEGNATSPHR